MSTSAIQKLVSELEELPDAQQEVVLGFLRSLKSEPGFSSASVERRGRNPAVQRQGDFLVFAGELESPDTDWVRIVRDEQDDRFVRQALGAEPRR